MEFRVECRRPRSTWLVSVEADMAELHIDKEDVHDKRNGERVMKRKSNYRKMYYKPIIRKAQKVDSNTIWDNIMVAVKCYTSPRLDTCTSC